MRKSGEVLFGDLGGGLGFALSSWVGLDWVVAVIVSTGGNEVFGFRLGALGGEV